VSAFRKLLIANRGEIACRVIRSARAMGLSTVAVYSDPDVGAVHVEEADEAVPLGGTASAESYLRVDKVLAAAALAGADAIHPGYGFLAESAPFAQACADAGMVFVGPSPAAIEAMGDKLRAKALMRAAGLPVLEAYEPSAVPADAYPVLIKAALGGGGKGMRVVRSATDLNDAVAAARRESGAAFGDETVFVEPYLERPRHVEVQIFGDSHGNALHLGERECSIQRRYQKVIEEAPSPAVDPSLRQAMGDAAAAAARAIGYTNAGTVEFILAPDERFYFLEVNTRLQVEHPVTELAWALQDGTALDLVRLQLLVAMGEPLAFDQDDLVLVGHAVEARLYAEDPANDFLPATGTLAVWDPDRSVRWDEGVAAGSQVGIHYDPLLAKAVAVAPARPEAALRLARALERSRVHGVTTNRDLLVATLRHKAFLAGDLHTGFIEEHLPPRARRADQSADAVHAVAAALVASRRRVRSARVLRRVPPGWRNNPSRRQEAVYERARGDPLAIGYAVQRDGTWVVGVDGVDHAVRVLAWPDQRADGGIDLVMEGRRLRVRVVECDDSLFVDSPLGHSAFRERPHLAEAGADEVSGGLHAPMPGAVLGVSVAVGDQVAQGQLLLVLEAMKMEHRITAPHEGTVKEVRVAPGDQVAADQILVVVRRSA
jgi:propionyl-CoA carboxylase alpha chain